MGERKREIGRWEEGVRERERRRGREDGERRGRWTEGREKGERENEGKGGGREARGEREGKGEREKMGKLGNREKKVGKDERIWRNVLLSLKFFWLTSHINLLSV